MRRDTALDELPSIVWIEPAASTDSTMPMWRPPQTMRSPGLGATPLPAGSTPAPGDLIVWDEHIGVVESVDPDGTIHTIEGNSSDRVSQRTYGHDGGGAVGYVRLG